MFPRESMIPKESCNPTSNTLNSASFRNDYSQYFVDTGQRPQNFIRDVALEERFKDYPKLDELIKLKDHHLDMRNHPPMCLKADLKTFKLSSLGQFDVILIDPPWKEYRDRLEGMPFYQQREKLNSWKIEELLSLDILSISSVPSFIFLWAGSENLEAARELLKAWGFKRCEDIVWLKTNSNQPPESQIATRNVNLKNERTFMQRVKEHCLVGMKGDLKRTSDSYFIHSNVDTDVIISEEAEIGSTDKPEEMYNLIERFCLGRKRIELFGSAQNVRKGWLTVGLDVPSSNYDSGTYESFFGGDTIPVDSPFGGRYIGTTPEIEARRPKSPKSST